MRSKLQILSGMLFRLLLHIGLGVAAVGCVTPMEFPPEPYIEFRENIVYQSIASTGDTTLMLDVKFYFQDGDGDIGRRNEDEVPPYVGDSLHNLHFHLWEVLPDSTYLPVLIPDTTGLIRQVEYSYHLHYIEPVNGNNALRGTITWTVDDFSSTALLLKGKTVAYSIYLYDRALHKSNTIYTAPLVL